MFNVVKFRPYIGMNMTDTCNENPLPNINVYTRHINHVKQTGNNSMLFFSLFEHLKGFQ